MALLIKAFQFFSGLSVVATTPFAMKFASKQEVTNLGKDRPVSYEEVVAKQEVISPKEESVKVTEVMNVAQKMMDDVSGGIGGEKQCFWWPEVKGLELLGCVYVNQLEKLFLFHYDAKKQSLNQITSLIHNNSGSARMKFKDGQTPTITRFSGLAFAWWYSWKADLIPEQHCKITKGGGRNNYTLTCDSETKTSGGKELKKPVSLESLSNKYKSQVS